MSSRERYLSEKIAGLGWGIPGLDSLRKYRFQQWVTGKERQKLADLEREVLQKLQAIASEQSAIVTLGFRGPVASFSARLFGKGGKEYGYRAYTDKERLEIVVVDFPLTDNQPIRKYREFLGRFEINGETTTVDLSCLDDQPFSWRRGSSDNDYPEKRLTLRESYRFMEEILQAQLVSPQSSQPAQLLE